MVVLDLFSGAGGLSEGFWRAGADFVAHVEANPYACDTLRTRASYWSLKKSGKLGVYYDYLSGELDRDRLWADAGVSEGSEVINKEISADTYDSIADRISLNLKNKNINSIDVLIGGPPCQAYSHIGRSFMGKKLESDHRNFLFKFYVRFLHEFKPSYFVFENVPGLKTAGGWAIL